MAGPNLARGAQERAAKAVSFDPQGLFAPGLGGVSYDPVTGAARLQQTAAQQQQQAMLQGLFGQAGAGAQALTPGAQQFGQQAFGAAGGLFQQAQAMDPLDLAEQRFSRLQSVLGPQRERQREGLESRLFAQGRLDSTGGNLLGGQLEQGFAAEDAALLDRMFSEAQGAQAQQFGQALQAGQAGLTTQGGLFGQLGQGVQAQQQVSAPLLQLLGLSTDVAGAQTQAQLAKAQALGNFNATMAAAPSTGGLLSGLATGALTAAGTAFGGPLGGAAAGQFGNLFGLPPTTTPVGG